MQNLRTGGGGFGAAPAPSRDEDEDAAESQRKRHRVSRACDQCFSKKDKCDGGHPVCSICLRLGRPCTYNRPERKRGPTSGVRQRLEAQVEMLESVLGFIIEQQPFLSSHLVASLNLSRDHPGSSKGRTSADIYPSRSRTEYARDVWKRSDLALSLRPALGLKLGSIDDEEDEAEVRSQADAAHARLIRQAHTALHGGGASPSKSSPLVPKLPSHAASSEEPSSMWSPSVRGSPRTGAATSYTPVAGSPHVQWSRQGRSVADVTSRTLEHDRHARPVSIAHLESSGEKAWQLPAGVASAAVPLVQAYLEFVHPLYPFLDRHRLVQLAHDALGLATTTQPSTTAAMPPSSLALLAATCVVSCNGFAVPEDGPAATEDVRHRQESLGRECRHLVVGLVVEHLEQQSSGAYPMSPSGADPSAVSLDHIQALLLLALADVCRGSLAQAWAVLGTCLRLASAAGLDVEPYAFDSRHRVKASDSQHTPRGGGGRNPTSAEMMTGPTASRRARERMTWWCMWLLDVFVAASLGRTPTLTRADFDVAPPEFAPSTIHSDFDVARDERQQAHVNFCSHIQLAEIVANAITLVRRSAMGASDAATPDGRAATPSAMSVVAQQLTRWTDSLPAGLGTVIAAARSEPGLSSLDLTKTSLGARHLVLLWNHARLLVHPPDFTSCAASSLAILRRWPTTRRACTLPPLAACFLHAILDGAMLCNPMVPEGRQVLDAMLDFLCPEGGAPLWRKGLQGVRLRAASLLSGAFDFHEGISYAAASNPAVGESDRAAGIHASSAPPQPSRHLPASTGQMGGNSDNLQPDRIAEKMESWLSDAELDHHAHALAYALGLTTGVEEASTTQYMPVTLGAQTTGQPWLPEDATFSTATPMPPADLSAIPPGVLPAHPNGRSIHSGVFGATSDVAFPFNAVNMPQVDVQAQMPVDAYRRMGVSAPGAVAQSRPALGSSVAGVAFDRNSQRADAASAIWGGGASSARPDVHVATKRPEARQLPYAPQHAPNPADSLAPFAPSIMHPPVVASATVMPHHVPFVDAATQGHRADTNAAVPAHRTGHNGVPVEGELSGD